MAYFTVREQIGPKRAITREGFLLCSDVPVGRLGIQRYAPEEITDEQGKPLIDSPGGILLVDRVADEVFAPAAIASGNGKPVVDDHPMDGEERIDVTPENWRKLACGTAMNLRRGTGLDDDLLLADLLITHQDAINTINGGKTEISIGYDCDYFETGPGRAEQRNIRINHFALVDSGRCGPRCAIGDSAPQPTRTGRAPRMTVRTWADWMMGQARKISRTTDAAEQEKIAGEKPPPEVAGEVAAPGAAGGGTHLHVHTGSGPGGGATTGEERDRGHRDDDDRRGRRDDDDDRGYRNDRRDDRRRDTTTDDPDEQSGRRFEALEDQVEELSALVEELSGEMGIGASDWGRMRDDVRRRRGSRDRRGRDDRARGRRDDRGRGGRDDDDRRGRDARRGYDDDDRGRGRDDDDDRRRGRDAEGSEEGGKSILGNLEEEAPPGTGDRARRARDSALLADAFQATVAYAELISPGIDLPVFDQAARPAKTFDAICGLRRTTLEKAYGTQDGKTRIDEITGGRTFDAKAMDCSRVRGLFLSLGAITKLANNAGGARTGDDAGGGNQDTRAAPAKTPTLAEVNAKNDEFWRKQNSAA